MICNFGDLVSLRQTLTRVRITEAETAVSGSVRVTVRCSEVQRGAVSCSAAVWCGELTRVQVVIETEAAVSGSVHVAVSCSELQ